MSKIGPEALFGTSERLEQEGIWLDYSTFRIRVLRAGPTNRKFRQALDLAMRPHQRAVAQGIMPEELAERITRRVWSKTVVTDWEYSDEDGEVHEHVMWFRNQEVRFSPEAVESLFEALPDLFADVREQSMRASLFRDDALEAAQGN